MKVDFRIFYTSTEEEKTLTIRAENGLVVAQLRRNGKAEDDFSCHAENIPHSMRHALQGALGNIGRGKKVETFMRRLASTRMAHLAELAPRVSPGSEVKLEQSASFTKSDIGSFMRG